MLAEAERLGARAPALALARLGAMMQEQWSLMTKMHQCPQEPKRLQGPEDYDGCCCATYHTRCLSLSLLLLVVDGRGAVMAASRAMSSHDDILTAWPEESDDFWGKSFQILVVRVSNCLPLGWLATPRCPGLFVAPVSVHHSNHCLRMLRSMTFLGIPCGWQYSGARECP